MALVPTEEEVDLFVFNYETLTAFLQDGMQVLWVYVEGLDKNTICVFY